MRIDSSGNVGIGTTAPTDYYADNLVVNAQSEGGITLIGTSAHENYLAWADGTSGTERYSGYLSYNHSSNFMRFATNGGSERMRINSSGNVGIGTTAPDAKLSVNGVASFGDGTALLPSIANFGDLDTGIFFPAADTIAFSEGGVEAMRITSAGNVGIGTTTPTTGSDYGNLSLNGTLGGQLAFHTGGTGKQFIYSSSTDLNIYNSIAGNLIFHTNSTERMRINSSGNVGIGTSSPDEKLTVSGDMNVVSGSTYKIKAQVSSSYALNIGHDRIQIVNAASNPFLFYYASTEILRITSTGNVGIGTTSPDALLSVNGVASFGDGTALLPSIANFGDLNTGMWFPAEDTIAFSEGGTEAMRIDSNGAVSIATTSAINGEKLKVQGKVYINAPESDSIFTTGACLIFPQTYNNIRQSTDHSLVFDAWNNGNVNSPLTIKQDGKIGIGTSSPSATLHVDTSNTNVTPDSSADDLFIENSDTGGITIGSGTSGTGTIYFGDSGDNSAGRLNYYHSDNSMRMFTAGAERMRIDSSGNVGIGTASPDAKLSVDGVASFGDGSAAAPSIANFGDLNTGIFFPAEDTIAFSEGGTEAVRIDSSGNLLVGTTTSPSSPLAGNKYIKLGTPSIEGNGTGDVSVSTTDVSLSNAKGAGFGFVGGYNTSGGAQFNAIVQFTLNGSITVVSTINNTGLTLTFSAGSGILKLKTSSGTVAANYTVIGA
jgi:hypothetical protein